MADEGQAGDMRGVTYEFECDRVSLSVIGDERQKPMPTALGYSGADQVLVTLSMTTAV